MTPGRGTPHPPASPAGLYIHVPFCRRRCHFCDFAITLDRSLAPAWAAGVEREMDLRAPEWRVPFDTLYFGGGTPSLAGPELIGRLVRAARERFDLARDAEITVEANPDDLDPRALGAFLSAGVDRLSLGAQSLHPGDLAFLGRTHTVEHTLSAFRDARAAGFKNISMDLLYGIPGAPAERLLETLGGLCALGPEHISAYQLTCAEGTPMSRRMERGEIEELSDGASLDLFLLVRERLIGAGYLHNEISSYPRAAAWESRHNRKYWEGTPYLGLGPAAHSHRPPVRSWNVLQTARYQEAMAGGGDPRAGSETLSADQQALERIFLGLRMARGLDLEAFAADFGRDLRVERRDEIAVLEAEALGRIEAGSLRLTPRGLALADGIALRLAGP